VVGDASSGAPRFPRNAFIACLVVVALGLSAWLFDSHLSPRARATGEPQGFISGAWFCPHGGSPGWRAWVVVANPGDQPVAVRATTFTTNGAGEAVNFSVGAGRQVYREVPATDQSSSTEIEYFGGVVGASSVIQAGATGGVAAEGCSIGPHRDWLMLDERTSPGETAYVVVMNPFAQDASFDVVIRSEDREVRPATLSPYVLGPRTSVGIRVNDYALLAESEATVAVEVVPRLGRVVAGGTVATTTALRAELGIDSAAEEWVIPSSGYTGQAELVAMDMRLSTAELSVDSQSSEAERVVSGPIGLSVQAGGVATFQVDGLADAGMVVRSTNQVPVVLALRLTGPNGDLATLSGAPAPASAWLVMATAPPNGGTEFVVLENPGRTDAVVTFKLIGGGAAPPLAPVTLPAGRTIQVPLSAAVGKRSVCVEVHSEGGTIVASGLSYSSGDTGYAATLGIPIKDLG
jgi:hypothetical protein